MLHTWSLAIEEQFYLVWPLLVVGVGLLVERRAPVRRRHQLRWVLVAVCIALGAASLLRMGALYHNGGDPSRVYYGTDTHATVLLIGAALGALSAGELAIARRAQRAVVVFAGCIGAVGLVVTMALLATRSPWLYRGGYGLVAVAIAAVIAAAAQPGANPLGRLLETRILVGLGLISYGVYLWHWPAAVWLTEDSTGLAGPHSSPSAPAPR